jgi:hypothetical protein
MDWQELSAKSHYQTALGIEDELEKGNVREASAGLKELIKAQPEKRTRSWAATIYNAREEIRDIQEKTPSLTNDVIEEIWEKCFQAAKREAEADYESKYASVSAFLGRCNGGRV